tara:strand:+ start:142 stop:570 length:429 start_codon:yes stop_codon:yes gene_type:complete
MSLALGVAHQLPGSRFFIDGAIWFAVAVGVCNKRGTPLACVSESGQNRTNLSNDTLFPVSGFIFSVLVDCLSMWSLAVGVGVIFRGDDPNAGAAVRGIDTASSNNKWDGAVAEAFQVRKAALEPHWLVNKSAHVLANKIFRL